MDVAVHWFRRDLRLDDHQALDFALASARAVVCLFVVDPAILARPDTGRARVHFLAAALGALDAELRRRGGRLVVRHGSPEEVVPAVARETGAGLVTAVRDAEPYARRRDDAVAAALGTGARLHLTEEQWLAPLAKAPPARVFGHFFRSLAGRLPTARPLPPPARGFAAPASDPLPDATALVGRLAGTIPAAGEKAAARRLEGFVADRLPGYARERDRVDLDATSRLSADLRFGTISVRRVFQAAAGAGGDKFVSELAWRDFYAAVLWQNPALETRAFRPEFDAVEWERSEERFEAWVEGRTGYPLVDAAMRQLRAEHWMHNRARMVVASFLCKDLHLDWRLGERHFMRELVDGDLASNNGGWQWTASTGTDPQPYFRIFNPELQRRRHDPDLVYVRRWVPEYGTERYPQPMVDHARERRRALAAYEAVASRAAGSR